MKIYESTIDRVKNISPDDLLAHGVLRLVYRKSDEFICPFCGNGSGDDATGIKPKTYSSHVGYKCQRCGEKFDNISILANHYGLNPKTEFTDVIQKACEQFNIALEKETSTPSTSPAVPVFDSANARKETEIIRSDLAVSDEPLINFCACNNDQWRGLPTSHLLKFGCKFNPKWTPPKSRAANKFFTPSPRILIPNGDAGYLARLTCALDVFDAKTRLFIKPKEKAGKQALFNPAALENEIVFVVEGEIDAMSIELVGFNAVALGGAADYRRLVDVLKSSTHKPNFIVLLDPDDAGRKSAPILKSAIRNVGCHSVIKFLTDDTCKLDCNQILVEQGQDNLRGLLESIFDDAKQEFDAATDETLEEETLTQMPLPFDEPDRQFYFNGSVTDKDNARRLERFCGDRVRWLVDDEKWLTWQESGVWQRGSDKTSAILPFSLDLSDRLLATAPLIKGDAKTLKKAWQIAYMFAEQKKYNPAINTLKGIRSIRITAADLDKHPNLLNCLNGVVDLETEKLYPHVDKRLALITQQCRAAFDPRADSAFIETFFKQIQPDEMTRAGLLRWLGYNLTGETAAEKFAVWTGASGANGKGTLSGTLLELLGDYATGLAPRALLRKYDNDSDRATTSLNAIENKRFAISEEMPLDGELDTSLIKNLTGGDRINLRRNYGEYRTIRNYAKINLSGNFAPKIENVHDGGILRRMINFNFGVQFGTAENPADPLLKKKLLLDDNLRGLLALLVHEAYAWYRGDGLIISPLMKQATERHLSQNDFIADFISDNYVFVPNASVKAKDLIESLKHEYPRECSRFKRNDLIQLVANVDGISYELDRTKTRVFKGIGKSGAPIQDELDGTPIDKDDLPFD